MKWFISNITLLTLRRHSFSSSSSSSNTNVASAIAATAAFAPAQQGRTSTFVASYENELGVVFHSLHFINWDLRSLTHHNSIDPSWKIAPTGFFDPFGLSEDIDQVNFDQYRAAELKREFAEQTTLQA